MHLPEAPATTKRRNNSNNTHKHNTTYKHTNKQQQSAKQPNTPTQHYYHHLTTAATTAYHHNHQRSSSSLLTIEQLEQLAKNSNRHINHSYLHNITHPHFKVLCHHFPPTIQPNVTSIIGLILNATTTILLLLYCPDAKSEAPRWVYGLTGLGLFAFQVMSCFDKVYLATTSGTKAAGLRDFLMHCVDVISNVFMVVGVTSTTRLSTHPLLLFTITLFLLLLFYLTHWQAYCSGVVNYNLFDVNEIRSVVVVLHVITAFVGAHIWDVAFLSNNNNYPIKFLPCLIFLLIGSVHAHRSLGDILLDDGVGRNGSSVAETSVLSPLVPIGLSIGMAVHVAKHSHSTILHSHPLLFTTLQTTTILKLTIQVVISHGSHSAMILLDPILLGPFILLIGQYFNWSDDYWLLLIGLTYSAGYLAYFLLRLSFDLLHFPPPKQHNNNNNSNNNNNNK